MTYFYLEIAGILVCIAVLFLLSLIEGALTEASPVTLRMSLEREAEKAPPLLSLIIESQTYLFLPLHLGIQISLVTAAILITHVSIECWPVWGLACALGLALATSVLFWQLFPRLLTQNEPERKLILLLHLLNPLIALCRIVATPVSSVLRLFKRLYQETETPAGPAGEETTEEEIQAYLEIGENEGILEKEDTQMIQSVVEFGDTLVREVMTPRTRISACSEDATMGALRDVMVESRHSRIPIYRGDIDHIVGVAYIRQLLAQYSQGKESAPLTSLIHPALFVPETKRVSALLKELQTRGDHTAIVIDEFGGVAGLVTIEDLVEEIVGEIRDEDQAKVSEIIEESPTSFVFRGSTELDHLEELAGKKFAGCDASTVAGLIAARLGRIPAPSEEFDLEGMKVQILDADRKRIRRLRIRFPQPAR
ncbi:MAG: hemolysin family protein [Acidobacteriota bacterium]|jgi:CBS domain containing-hemolysin-like protein